MKTLSKDKLRIKCAEALGWTRMGVSKHSYLLVSPDFKKQCVVWSDGELGGDLPPDFPNSHDACQQLRDALTERTERADYVLALGNAATEAFDMGWGTLNATPEQICRAFCAAKGIL